MITYALKTSAPLLLYFIVQRNGSGRARATSSRAAMEREGNKKNVNAKHQQRLERATETGSFETVFCRIPPLKPGLCDRNLSYFALRRMMRSKPALVNTLLLFFSLLPKKHRALFFLFMPSTATGRVRFTDVRMFEVLKQHVIAVEL